MKSSRFVGFFASFCSCFSAPGRNREDDCKPQKATTVNRMPPRLELLEDRCLPSVATTIPSLGQIAPIVALPDIWLAAMPKGNPTAVLLGDSISWGYANGAGTSVWNTSMAPLGIADYGVVGQTTQSLLFQMSLGVLAGISPAEVIVEIGANNLLQGDSPQDTAAGIITDVNFVHLLLPQSQVLVLGVFPGKQSPSDPYRSEGTQTNQLVSQMLAGDPRATFLDVGSIFLEPDGTISNSMMFDYLHPTELGYQALTDVLQPVLEQSLLPYLIAFYPYQATALPTGSIPLDLTGVSLRDLIPPSSITAVTQPVSSLPISP